MPRAPSEVDVSLGRAARRGDGGMIDVLLATLLLTGLLVFLLHHSPAWQAVLSLWKAYRIAGRGLLVGVVLLGGFLVARTLLPAAPSAAVDSVPETAGAARTTPEERRDEQEGYSAGLDLAGDPHHRGGRVPKPQALAALAEVRGKGRSAAYIRGFERGYAAGLARAGPTPPTN